jgi:hypothetical protein
MKVAILKKKRGNYFGEYQINPFIIDKKELKSKLNFDEDIKLDYKRNKYDILFIQSKLDGVTDKKELINEVSFFKKIRLTNKNSKIVFLDYRDSTSLASFKVMPYIDLYVKAHHFNDLNKYGKNYFGGEIWADFLIKKFGLKKGKGYSFKLPKKYKNKLVTGWNLGTGKKVYDLFLKQKNIFFNKKRKIDINCRIGLSTNGRHIKYHRYSILIKLLELENKYNIIATGENIEYNDYLNELKSSEMCVSPFGWGEVCYRDFEAILCGCLLIKPSMGHVNTEPDIYIPYKTYVPIKWDLSDLKEKCTYYLENKKERKKIVKNAYKEYMKYWDNKKFLDKIKEILIKLNFV